MRTAFDHWMNIGGNVHRMRDCLEAARRADTADARDFQLWNVEVELVDLHQAILRYRETRRGELETVRQTAAMKANAGH